MGDSGSISGNGTIDLNATKRVYKQIYVSSKYGKVVKTGGFDVRGLADQSLKATT